MRKKGFTLIEMVIVIAIIAILLAILIPTMSGIITMTKTTACAANRDALRSRLEFAYLYDEDVEEIFAEESAKTECPLGGAYSYIEENGMFVVSCSHCGTDPIYKRTADFASAATVIGQQWDAANRTSLTVNSSALSNPNSWASKFYNALTPAQQAVIDDYVWVVKANPSDGAFRIFFAAKSDTSKTTFDMYKYDPGTNQFQYSSQGALYENGDLNPNNAGSKWGYYDDDGNYIANGWGSLMRGNPKT